MPLDYGKVIDPQRTIHLSIPFEGMGTVELDYRPGAVGRKEIIEAAQAELSADDDGSGVLIAFFIKLVAAWDVELGGQLIPLTPEGLGQVKDTFLQNLINAIGQDAYTGEAKGTRTKKH